MAYKFFAQKIFDSKMACIGVELLIREIPFGETFVGSPRDIMTHPDFSDKDLYAIDMQILTYLDLLSSDFIKSGIKYVFINQSDQILKSIILGDDSSSPFSNLKSLAKTLHPVKIVVEVNELSRIRVEHLTLILQRLKALGFKVAQDDYTLFRQEYLAIEWDFIKVEHGACLPEDMPRHTPVVIERSSKEILNNHCESTMHQGFDFHMPTSLQSVLAELFSKLRVIEETA